jgi:hypothetical protein
MLYKLVLSRSCTHGLALAAIVAALSIALAPTAKAQITWTITVNAPASGNAPTYNLSCLATGTTHPPVPCPNTDPTLITVNRDDSVYWQTGAPSLEIWIVHDDAIVDDANDCPTHHHHAKNGRDGGDIDVNAPISAGAKHKYSIFAYDWHTKNLYFDDPRIIIGGSGLEESLRALNTKCEALRKKLEHGPEGDEAGELCQQIEALQESLESKKKK